MIKKALLAKIVNKTNNISIRMAIDCVDTIFKTMAAALSDGERIEIRGFGTFYVKNVKARKTVFAKNGEVPEHWRILFKPSQGLKLAAWERTRERKPVSVPVH